MSFVKGGICSYRSVFFLHYPYLIVGIKISWVISVSIFFRLLPHFFVVPGGPFQCLYSGHWSELGSKEDKEIPPSFSSFSYFYSFVLRFPRISRLHYRQSLGSRTLPSNDVTKTRNPYPSLAPPYRRRLWVKIHPSLTWPNCVLDTQIISKRAVYIIMLISGRISFFQLVALVLKLICYRQSEREWELIVSSVISRATSKENVMTPLFRQFLFSRNLLVAIS